MQAQIMTRRVAKGAFQSSPVFFIWVLLTQGFWGGSVVKSPSASAGDVGSISGPRRSLEEGMATHSSIPAWEIPWMEGAWQATVLGSQRVGHD